MKNKSKNFKIPYFDDNIKFSDVLLCKSPRNDYEEGVLSTKIPVRNKWYRFWLPKTINYEYGSYIKISNMKQTKCRICNRGFVESVK